MPASHRCPLADWRLLVDCGAACAPSSTPITRTPIPPAVVVRATHAVAHALANAGVQVEDWAAADGRSELQDHV